MKKNLMFGSIVTAVLLLGAGCGGGSSSDDSESTTSTTTTASTTTTTEKVGYYLDSAVAGVTYQCASQGASASGEATATEEDSTTTEEDNTTVAEDENTTVAEDENTTTTEEDNTTTTEEDNTTTTEDENTTSNKPSFISRKTVEGTTGADGSFAYENGAVCTFSVGGITLRTVDTTQLQDNIVFEDDITTAQFLQTLDKDGNPENGIQIDEQISQAIASDTELKEIPKTEEELAEVVSKLQEKVEGYEGTMVTQEEAKAHLEDTAAQIEAMQGHFSGSASAESSTGAAGEVTGSASEEGANANAGTATPSPEAHPVETPVEPEHPTPDLNRTVTEQPVVPVSSPVTTPETEEEASASTQEEGSVTVTPTSPTNPLG